MRFYEFSTVKPIKPLSPAQQRIAAKKRQVDQARDALKRERELQKHHQDLERQWKSQRRA